MKYDKKEILDIYHNITEDRTRIAEIYEERHPEHLAEKSYWAICKIIKRDGRPKYKKHKKADPLPATGVIKKKKRRLFYDIETSFCKGYFWRPGWNQTIHPHQVTDHAKIISIHWSWEGESTVHNMDWGLNDQCDKDMLSRFIPILNSADEVITHNGKRFDTPWLRTRSMHHGLPFNHTYNEIDTYKLAKKYLNLPSYSLKECCNYFGLEAKLDPGGHQTWTNIIFHKDKKSLKHLLYYGDGDIKSLKALFYKLRPYVMPNLQYSVLIGDGKFQCPECYELGAWNKKYVTAQGTIQHYMKCKDESCSTYWKISNKTYEDYIKYKMINGIK